MYRTYTYDASTGFNPTMVVTYSLEFTDDGEYYCEENTMCPAGEIIAEAEVTVDDLDEDPNDYYGQVLDAVRQNLLDELKIDDYIPTPEELEED